VRERWLKVSILMANVTPSNVTVDMLDVDVALFRRKSRVSMKR
jgi:hypothetical protein